MPDVAVVTCRNIPEIDHDEELLLTALTSAGLTPHLVAWDDPGVGWRDYSLVVIRSTWNYIDDLPAFLAWAKSVAAVTTLRNPLRVLEWNTHKGYLAALAEQGVPIVPTAWVSAGADLPLAEVMHRHGWSDVVAKPVVGANSVLTDRIVDPTDGESLAFWRRLTGSRDAMVQPYLRSVEDYGERSVIWIDGALTHSIRKSPRLGDAPESVSEAMPIAADERALAEQIVGDIEGDLLYARIDLIRDDDGRPRLAELELVEPSLFLLQHPPALHRLVAAVAARA